jgi:hypothetical protein
MAEAAIVANRMIETASDQPSSEKPSKWRFGATTNRVLAPAATRIPSRPRLPPNHMAGMTAMTALPAPTPGIRLKTPMMAMSSSGMVVIIHGCKVLKPGKNVIAVTTHSAVTPVMKAGSSSRRPGWRASSSTLRARLNPIAAKRSVRIARK